MFYINILMEPIWTGIIIGSAFIFGAMFFYFTMRNQPCYEDVTDNQISHL